MGELAPWPGCVARRLPGEPGTYALILQCRLARVLQVGKLGRLRLRPGFYVYVGSALGPGGLRARVGHHSRISVRPHWHVDYLRRVCDWVDAWFEVSGGAQEHAWAATVASLPSAAEAFAGFGASDCSCRTHLYAFPEQPPWDEFKRRHPRATRLCGSRQVPSEN